MGDCPCKEEQGQAVQSDDIRDILSASQTFHTFAEGEYVQSWSTSQQSWSLGKIAKAFSVDGNDGEFKVTAGTYKVIVSGCKKYVGPELLRKVTTCGTCRRPAAAGFVDCCRTCKATRGRAHGQTCEAVYDVAFAPPGKSPQASQVPREDTVDATRGGPHGPTHGAKYDAAPAPPEMSPEASWVPSEDAVCGPKKQKCTICKMPATVKFGVCCKICQNTQGRSHGPACDAACDAALAPPEMSSEASWVLREDSVSGHKKQKCKICKRLAAKVTFGVCCKICQNTKGQSHGPTCDAACDVAPPEMSSEASQVPSEAANVVES